MFSKYKDQIFGLECENQRLRNALEELSETKNGCVQGDWCAGCVWSVLVHGRHYDMYICGFERCKQFSAKYKTEETGK